MSKFVTFLCPYCDYAYWLPIRCPVHKIKLLKIDITENVEKALNMSENELKERISELKVILKSKNLEKRCGFMVLLEVYQYALNKKSGQTFR